MSTDPKAPAAAPDSDDRVAAEAALWLHSQGVRHVGRDECDRLWQELADAWQRHWKTVENMEIKP